jgi:hypothetical protein
LVDQLRERLRQPGPKRLLALDGGGIRGLVTVGYLARIEALLRERHGRPDLVLADYFDLIGGTSTGSIIASGLALGWPVSRIRELYLELGEKAFVIRKALLGKVSRMLGARYDERPLEELLQGQLGGITLGSEALKTGLVVVAKRVDTSSVWVLNNLPDNKYYAYNKDMELWKVVRASAAAPTYFRPRWIRDLGDGEEGVFVDGGVSMHNNPALQLLMVASLEGFSLQWPMGDDRMFVCSVGTGSYPSIAPREKLRKYNNLDWAGLLVSQMMDDATELGQTVLQWMSHSPTNRRIDTQIGALESDVMGGKPLIHYTRYNLQLSDEGLAELGLRFDSDKIERLREMSDTRNIADLDAIGIAAASRQVEPAHFLPAFDL